MKNGVQISSLKPLLQTTEQVQEAFSHLKALGCNLVQLQWIGRTVPVEDISRILDENQIACVSVQDFYETVLEDFEYYVRLNAATGGIWLCVSRIPERLKSPAGLNAYIAELQAMQQKLNPLGQKLCFHPVSGDYAAIPGMNPVEYLLEHMPELTLCLDLYHLNKNCDDMPAFIRRWSKRICMAHFKDAVGSTLVPAGQGDTCWNGVVSACLEAGVSYAFVEQEQWNRNPYDCLKEAADWLNDELCKSTP